MLHHGYFLAFFPSNKILPRGPTTAVVISETIIPLCLNRVSFCVLIFSILARYLHLRAAEKGGFSYSIVRPGQIKGDPFATYSAKKGLGVADSEKGASKRMVSLKQGDSEAGDVNPSSVAAAFTQVGFLLRLSRWICREGNGKCPADGVLPLVK